MASESLPSIEDMKPVGVPDSDRDDDAEWIDLEPGDSVIGEIREIKPNCGRYNSTVLKLSRGVGDTVLLWSKPHIDNQITSNDLGEGDVIAIVVEDEPRTFTTDDGEEREYHFHEVRV